ncbi:ABC transporter ATP-binding protein [Burkholderia sp. BCC0405]|uniref:ABC transporter ATP-binding protein n=1 Tax=Burkholderia sp. BCC0405 TaxID=2676298 RepID=UPI001588CFD5|nr:ABC transporter ATP-binding protein [Burkholderia sp. BCC0405]
MLRFDNLGKRYDKRVIFKGLSHASGAGCVGLYDETGSGKSTLLAILAGAIDADEGEVWIGGHSLRTALHDAKSALAYVPDDCLAYPSQTGREFLGLVAAARNAVVDTRTLELADRFGLAPHLEKRFEQMSFGTRKKLFLTATTLGAPAVVIADDPDSGLDAASRAVLIDLFRTLAADRTVFFSSHDPALARACDARITCFAALGFAG